MLGGKSATEQAIEGAARQAIQVANNADISNSNNTVILQNNVFNQVESDSEFEERVLEVFKNNYPQLSDRAREEALQRAQKFIDIMLSVIHEEGGDLTGFDTPRILAATYDAQRTYAENADDEQAKAMARLLQKLARESPLTLKDVLIKQALQCLPMLAKTHVNALGAIVYLTKMTLHTGSVDPVMESLDQSLGFYIGKVPSTSFDYEYMESCNVGVTDLMISTPNPYERIFMTYPHIFHHDVLASNIPENINKEALVDVLIPIEGETDRFRMSPDSCHKVIADRLNFSYQFNDDPAKDLLEKCRFSPVEIREVVDQHNPELAKLLDILNQTGALRFKVNAVGHVIGLESWKSAGGMTRITIDDLIE